MKPSAASRVPNDWHTFSGLLFEGSFFTFFERPGGFPSCGIHAVSVVVSREFGQDTVAIDGTKVLANASKHSAVSRAGAERQLQSLQGEIEELLTNTKSSMLLDFLRRAQARLLV